MAAILAAVVTACVKFLNPTKQSGDHGRAGKQYQALAEDLGGFYKLDLVVNIKHRSTGSLLGALNTFKRPRQEIHESAPIIPSDTWRKTIGKSEKRSKDQLRDVHAHRIARLMKDLNYSLEEGRLPQQPTA